MTKNSILNLKKIQRSLQKDESAKDNSNVVRKRAFQFEAVAETRNSMPRTGHYQETYSIYEIYWR